jgi:hypothetical protein
MPLEKFQAINSLEAADYLDGLKEERPASAGIAIHMAWLEHSSSFEFFKGERLLPEMHVDMMVLYKAAAAAFESWSSAVGSRELPAARRVMNLNQVEQPLRVGSRELPTGGRVMNLKQAEQRLSSVADPEQATLAFLFLSNVIRMSIQSSYEQDLGYFLELFLRCIKQEGMIESIASGEIKRREAQLADPDYW